MGKIKSAVITAILVAAVVVLGLFATISFTVPGSGGVNRYNSFISSIHLGGDLTGEAYTVLYPEGVISAAEYTFGIPDIPEDAEGDERAEYEQKRQDYIANYEQYGSVYIEKDRYEDEETLKASVLSDAAILSARFGQKGYTDYSVSVQDDYTIKVSVPTNFTYSAYKLYDTTGRTEETTKISNAITYLAYSGELTLCNTEVGTRYNNSLGAYILTPLKADVTSYFKDVTKYAMGGNYAVKITLTDSGREQFKTISNAVLGAESDTSIGFYIGENKLISLTVSEVIDGKSFYISVSDNEMAQNYAIALGSAAKGETLSLNYDTDNMEIVYATSALGENAAVYLGVALLLVLVAAIVYSVIRYKKLGLVNALMLLIYSLVIITAVMLLDIRLTIAGAFVAVLGLALLAGSNFALFEAVRKETKKGKIMQSAVKSGYKAVLTTILDLHIILIVASLMVALICVGELAACGFIFFIASIASYILYWFTRLMWFVISSPVKDKFRFCGFTREVLDD